MRFKKSLLLGVFSGIINLIKWWDGTPEGEFSNES